MQFGGWESILAILICVDFFSLKNWEFFFFHLGAHVKVTQHHLLPKIK